MLSYYEMYDIVGGIWITFSNKRAKKRSLSVNHSEKTRDDVQSYFPERKYKDWTKENFIIANLYVNFNFSPSSMSKAIEHLTNADEKDIFKFKNELMNYNKFLTEDLDRLKVEDITINSENIMEEYRNNKIKWFTFYFFMMYFGDLEKYEKSRVNGYLIKKIRKMLMFITFSQKSMSRVKLLINDKIEL